MELTDIGARLAVLESNMQCLLEIKEQFVAHTARHREAVLEAAKEFVPRSELDRVVERLERKTSNIAPWVTVVVGLMMASLGALVSLLIAR